MQTRLDYSKAASGSVQAMYKLQKYADESGLDHSLLELVKTRVSQMNGCAFCIDMHTKDARRGRDRAAALRPERVARGALLLRARARRAGLGGGSYADLPDPRVGRRVRGRPRTVRRGGVSQADDGRHRHQRLEPPRHRLPAGGREVPAARVGRRAKANRARAAERAGVRQEECGDIHRAGQRGLSACGCRQRALAALHAGE